MRRFTDEEKEVMELEYLNDTKLEVIAKKLGRPLSSVSSWITANVEATRHKERKEWIRVQVKIPKPQYETLKRQARKAGITVPAMIRRRVTQ